jgi:glycosyltransferase involved in cell wall biosynthesis
MHISLIGTRGVPARYGGFETCVEEVGRRLVAMGEEVTVYCRVPTAGNGGASAGGADASAGTAGTTEPTNAPPPAEYLGMRLVHLPAMRRKTLETLSHTALSVGHALIHRCDVAFVFNAANAPLLPLLRLAKIPVVTHVDGLEWKRAKWSGAGQRYYQRAEALAVRWSDALIADAHGISDYYRERFGVDTDYIPYGAPKLAGIGADRLAELDLTANRYHLVVARLEPENHVHLAVEGYRRSAARYPLIVVGSAPYAQEYTDRVHSLAGNDPRIRFLGGVWDQELLDALYANALTYIHGHSVGGTNPSLLRAMGAGTATSAFDVNFNREVLGGNGRYFSDPADLAALCTAAEADEAATLGRGRAMLDTLDRYDWDAVARDYRALAARVLAHRHGFAAPVPRSANLDNSIGEPAGDSPGRSADSADAQAATTPQP